MAIVIRKLIALGAGTMVATLSFAQGIDREVSTDGGRAPLHGSLMIAAAAHPRPAVLLISGSGPTDRSGNSSIGQIRPATIRLLAAGLAERGIASLRYDKRGVGDSAPAAPPKTDLRFMTYVDDAVLWTRFLLRQPGVTCVILAGHSEGALIAILAAERTPVCGLALLSGAGRPAKMVLAEQLAGIAEPERTAALATLRELVAGRTVADPPIPALFRSSVQPLCDCSSLRKRKAVLVPPPDHSRNRLGACRPKTRVPVRMFAQLWST